MTEIYFYHLERQPLERVLPVLLERSLERGWRAVVQADSDERVDVLDQLLWTFRDDTFLPHGTAADGRPEDQPVFLTALDDDPNGAHVRFLVDCVQPSHVDGYERVVYLFDGRDEAAVQRARSDWKANQSAGHDVTYWQQDDHGKWQKKA